MAFSVTQRPIEPDERPTGERLLYRLDRWTWIVSPMVSLAFACFWIGRGLIWLMAAGDKWDSVPVILATVGGIAGLRLSVATYHMFREERDQIQADYDNGQVQIIHVTNATFIEQASAYSEGPILYLPLDDETILFLWGQWLYDPFVYGAEDHYPEGDEETFLNGQEALFAFPCTEFTLHRLPQSGLVLRIETGGEPATCVKELDAEQIALQNLRPSEIFKGTFDDLPTAMSRRICAMAEQSLDTGAPGRSD